MRDPAQRESGEWKTVEMATNFPFSFLPLFGPPERPLRRKRMQPFNKASHDEARDKPGKQLSLPLGNGRAVEVSVPGLAMHVNGEAMVRLGDTCVLVTAVMSHKPREGMDYFPLMVDFEERFYAAGKFSGSRFIKRETRPTDEAILSGRIIDRTIRPRFPKGMRNEVQIVVTNLSYDGENDPDMLGLIGASVALSISDIPWNGPIAGLRAAEIDDALVLNPTETQRKASRFEFVLSSTSGHVNMLEGGANGVEIPEDEALRVLEGAYAPTQEWITAIAEFAAAHGKEKKAVVLINPAPEAYDAVREFLGEKLETLLFSPDISKHERMHQVNDLKADALNHFAEGDALLPRDVDAVFESEIDRLVHTYALEQGKRSDGRRLNELRNIESEIDTIPRIHGSAVFTRGETRALATVTLGGPGAAQLIDSMEGESKKYFMFHYNFPPYSVGEARPMRGASRRDIGHGILAEKSVRAVMPDLKAFPYAIRVVSEILASNGSSSMASVCGASLALMAAGVPLRNHVAGIAMGVMVEEEPKDPKAAKHAILTDIQGPEDHHGDMDLKIAGSRKGITGMQMDVKIAGVTLPILKEAFEEARRARESILDVMERAIAEPRPEVAVTAPKVQVLQINPERIGDLIGPGGKIIRAITEATGAVIDVEQDGSVFVSAVDPKGFKDAVARVEAITKELEPGEEYEGPVTRIFPFGAMVEVMPGKEALIHVSELREWNVGHAGDAFEEGMIVQVVVKEIDDQGRVNLGLKDASAFIAAHPPKPGRPQGPGGGGGFRGGGGDRRGGRGFGGGGGNRGGGGRRY